MRPVNRIGIAINESPAEQGCDAPGCRAAGQHRAPRSRDRLDHFYWFCLEHVREYNRAWNYCAGMSERDIEAEVRRDTVWRRPSWPLGGNGAAGPGGYRARIFKDPFEVFGKHGGENGRARANGAGRHNDIVALQTMDLAPPVNLTQLKARYKELVKQHHPDVNGGDNAAEERLKDINEAYSTLMKRFTA